MLASTGDITGQWMKHFQELLNPVNMACVQEAVPETSRLMESISMPEVTMAGGKVGVVRLQVQMSWRC